MLFILPLKWRLRFLACMVMVDLCFYEKPISNPYMILYESAVSVVNKRTIMLKEGVRKWSNTYRRMVAA